MKKRVQEGREKGTCKTECWVYAKERVSIPLAQCPTSAVESLSDPSFTNFGHRRMHLPVNCVEEASFLSAIYSVTNLTCQSSLTLLLAKEYNSAPVGFSIISADFSFIYYEQTTPELSKTYSSVEARGSTCIIINLNT